MSLSFSRRTRTAFSETSSKDTMSLGSKPAQALRTHGIVTLPSFPMIRYILIGMHLRRVAVPVRTGMNHIGEAMVLCARTRPKYIGGPRAVYQD